MSIADSAALAALFLISVHVLTVVLAGFRCRRRKPKTANQRTAVAAREGVTLVRPLRGIESHSSQTLAASLLLTHPRHEVLFCVADGADPVVPLVEAALRAHPNVDARLLIGADCIGSNPKLNNMLKGWREAKYDWVCFADSNLLTPLDYLERIEATAGPGVGAVSAPPVGTDPRDFWGDLECAFLNTFEARWQYAVDTVGFGFCQGKTLYLHRSSLGPRGLARLADEPAEDAALTKVVWSQSKRVRLVAPPFAQPIGPRLAREVWDRQLRWARLRRATFPYLYAPEIFLGCAPAMAALAVAAAGYQWSIPLSLGALLAAWFTMEYALAALAGWPASLASCAAWVLRDLMMPALWCAAWAGHDFTWHGARLTTGDGDPRGIDDAPREIKAG